MHTFWPLESTQSKKLIHLTKKDSQLYKNLTLLIMSLFSSLSLSLAFCALHRKQHVTIRFYSRWLFHDHAKNSTQNLPQNPARMQNYLPKHNWDLVTRKFSQKISKDFSNARTPAGTCNLSLKVYRNNEENILEKVVKMWGARLRYNVTHRSRLNKLTWVGIY